MQTSAVFLLLTILPLLGLVGADDSCQDVACVQGFPVCDAGSSLRTTQPLGTCCPQYECVPNVCTPGEYYTMPDDPCLSCECGDDGQPTTKCMMPRCAAPNCPAGKTLKQKEGKCCEFDCVDKVCTPGEYYTKPEDLCTDCKCGFDGLPTDDCGTIACSLPYCPPDKTHKKIEGTCCGYECVDRDCSDVLCTQGFPVCDEGQTLRTTYPPEACCPQYECVPDNTKSDMVCQQPIVCGPCEAYMPSWGYNKDTKQCEQFVYGGCQGNANRFSTKETCEAKCLKECAVVACITPSCAAGSKIQRTERPGSCCPLVQCVKVDNVWMNEGKLSYVGIIVIVFGSIIIIGSVVGMVTCYLYKKKHRNAEKAIQHYFNNLGYIGTDEKKIPIPVTPIIDNNDTKRMKEKEAL